MNIKNIWNHHPVIETQTKTYTMKQAMYDDMKTGWTTNYDVQKDNRNTILEKDTILQIKYLFWDNKDAYTWFCWIMMHTNDLESERCQ